MITFDPLKRLLDYLSQHPPGRTGSDADELHRSALSYKTVERLPIIFQYPVPDDFPFQALPNGEIYRDPQRMLYNELLSAFNLGGVSHAIIGDDYHLSIRPNWGTVLISSIAGANAEQIDNGTPWVRHDDVPAPSLESISELNPEIEKAGWMPRVIETYTAYRECLADYPELRETIEITLPDLQGPFDNLELIRGSELFLELLTEPELVARALKRMAEIQIDCVKLLQPRTQESCSGFTHQHGFLVKGEVLLRNDSVVMISPELYKECILPWDRFVLEAVGGGGIHSCGKAEHVVYDMLEIDALLSFDFGQSFMNDVDSIYRVASTKSKPLLRVQPTEEELASGSICSRFPTGVTLLYAVESLDKAKNLFDSYRRACQKTGYHGTA